jgi:nucleotide-binding universal stress UspA family protein
LKRGDNPISIFPTKVLWATDGSEDAELATTTAVGLAKLTASELHVVHVGPVVPERFEPTDVEPVRMEQEARRTLDEQVKKVENLGGAVAQSHLRMGKAAEEVVGLAEEIGAGLIAVGSRGRGRIRRALMGSVSDSVVRHAHCPVMVVRWKPLVFPATILLATDASQEARVAATTAADLARRTGSELHLVHVGSLVTHGAGSGVEVGPLPGVHQGELDRQAQWLLDAEVEQMKSSGIDVAGAHLRRGRAGEEVIVLAEETGADLIAIGSSGRGGVRRALMGSVSDSVVRHAHCPVLVAR